MQNPTIQQVIETLRGANSVLITVKNSPSVDELTAAISLTLILNHMEKNATTVFSGQVPSTLEFLQPEMAIEQNTDSLRDFIIALDKAKADKLRYKVEDNVVRIFITPYKASITEEDLEFSQGDLNVDVVVALGVLSKDDFDEAIVSHGRILHDATVIGITSGTAEMGVGTVNWQDSQASGVSEMIAGISDLFGADILDNQIATALLTGIVSETGRFKNEKTTPQALAVSSRLMAAGANQQLIAEKLEQAPTVSEITPINEMPATDEGIALLHMDDDVDDDETSEAINIDEEGNMMPLVDEEPPQPEIEEDPSEIAQDQHADIAADVAEPMGTTDSQDEGEQQDDDSSPIVSERVMLSSPSDPTTVHDESASSDSEESAGLFGNSLHDMSSDADAKGDSEQRSALEDTTLNRENKVLQPIGDEDSEPQFLLDPIPSEDAPQPDQDAVGKGGDQTLRQLERAVGSPHLDVSTPDPVSNIDEYMGSATPPVNEPAAQPAEEASVVETEAPVPPPVESESSDGDLPSMPDVPVQKYEAPSAPPSGSPIQQDDSTDSQVIVPTDDVTAADTPVAEEADAAPAVPPPLMPAMPQADGGKQPMFFEADGSQSNPFVSS